MEWWKLELSYTYRRRDVDSFSELPCQWHDVHANITILRNSRFQLGFLIYGYQLHSQESEPVQSLQTYVVAIFHRRRTLIVLAGGVLLGLSLAVAFLWPPVYKSMATILIEEQEIPSELVHSTITSYAAERIEMIKRQVMSRTTLWKVVEQYNLYPDLRRTNPTEEVVKRFTNDIAVEVISADVVDKRAQHPSKPTIAFTVAYQSNSPDLAQKVANELTSLFLGENLKSRERQAQEATSFLQQEAENLSKHIGEVDEKIATFKHRASGALPELMPLNLQLMSQSDRELMDIDQQIRTLEERKNYLEGELATIKPNTPIMSVTGERILDSAERLRSLRAEYAGSSANRSPDHPDIMKMKQEIEAWKRNRTASRDRGSVQTTHRRPRHDGYRLEALRRGSPRRRSSPSHD